MSERRDRYARRERRMGWLTGVLYGIFGLLFLVLVGPVLADQVMGATKKGGECRIIRVVEADVYSLDCEVIGRQTAQLLGASAPDTRSPNCREEFLAGLGAKWAARRLLWGADEIEATIDGFGWSDTTLVILRLDGAGLASQLVAGGHAVQDAGYTTVGWCGGALDALDANG